MQYVERHLTARITASLDSARAVCVLGARQCGKSTLVSRIGEARGMRVISLDDEQHLAAATNDPMGFVMALREPTVIDEIQRAPELMLAIKRRLDASNEPGRFLLTGSADLRAMSRVRDALPGRLRYHVLHPLSQREIAAVPGSAVDRLFDAPPRAGTTPPVQFEALAETIAAGGYPESLRVSDDQRPEFFEGYVDSMLGRDVLDIERIRDTEALSRVLSLAAARSAGLLNVTSIARDAGVTDKTAASYLDVLVKMYLLARLPSWHVNLGQRVVKSPKLHVADSGLLTFLVGADARRIATDADLAGRALETFVVSELVRQCSWTPRISGMFHMRDRERREVDVVVERRDGTIIAIEVKRSITVRPSDTRWLAWLRDKVGDRFRAGYLLHPGTDTVPFGDRIWAMPIASLWS